MKKETKRTLLSLFVIGIMAVSVLSYAFMDIFGKQTSQQEEINGVVIKGNVSEILKQQYISRGWTFLTVYYDYTTQGYLPELEDLPNQMTTPDGRKQMIVVEINEDEPRMVIESLNSLEEVNYTSTDLFEKLCSALYYPPVECLAANISVEIPKIISNSSTT